MNTAVALLIIIAIEQIYSIVIEDQETKNNQKSRADDFLQCRTADCPQVGGSQQITSAQQALHRDSSEGAKGIQNSEGGSSKRDEESGKRGEDFKETAKKTFGSHEGHRGGYVSGSQAEGNSGKSSNNQRHSHHKAGAKKRNKKISKGFHEEYRKDEEKSKHGHWEHEHTEGRYIKFGKKRGHKGSKKADQSGQKEGSKIDDGIAKNFKGMDQLASISWSNKKGSPKYHLLSQNT